MKQLKVYKKDEGKKLKMESGKIVTIVKSLEDYPTNAVVKYPTGFKKQIYIGDSEFV